MVFSIWMDETGVLIFKAFDKNPRFDQLLPGQGILYSYESFFFLLGGGGCVGKGSRSSRALIVNLCTFINNFCIH